MVQRYAGFRKFTWDNLEFPLHGTVLATGGGREERGGGRGGGADTVVASVQNTCQYSGWSRILTNIGNNNIKKNVNNILKIHL